MDRVGVGTNTSRYHCVLRVCVVTLTATNETGSRGESACNAIGWVCKKPNCICKAKTPKTLQSNSSGLKVDMFNSVRMCGDLEAAANNTTIDCNDVYCSSQE